MKNCYLKHFSINLYFRISPWIFVKIINGRHGILRGPKNQKSKNSRIGVTKICRPSWLTNSALVHEPKCGRRGGICGVSANEYSVYTGAQINFGDLAPNLTYARVRLPLSRLSMWNCAMHACSVPLKKVFQHSRDLEDVIFKREKIRSTLLLEKIYILRMTPTVVIFCRIKEG
jgi:hypothetical protein